MGENADFTEQDKQNRVFLFVQRLQNELEQGGQTKPEVVINRGRLSGRYAGKQALKARARFVPAEGKSFKAAFELLSEPAKKYVKSVLKTLASLDDE